MADSIEKINTHSIAVDIILFGEGGGIIDNAGPCFFFHKRALYGKIYY